MSYRHHLKSGLLLSIGGATGALSTFARNIIIARLISVEDFGIAATFGITMAFIEMTSVLGVDRLIVQSPEGNEPRLQATVQAFNVLRGALLSLILFAIAGPVANLFELPEVVGAFQWLAILPFIRGFVHMDTARAQREMRFAPSVLTENGAQLLTMLLAAPLAIYFKDYRVMLWLITIQVIANVIISFLTASRKYRWAWDMAVLRHIFSFGWPLMINGFLLFGVFQADRAIVGAAFSMEELGWFSAAFTLTLFPSMVLASMCQSFFMPMLSADQLIPDKFQFGAIATMKACLLLGVLLYVGLALAGPALLLLLFGHQYAEATLIVGWLALVQGIRTVKSGPVIVAISCGQTKLPLYANMVRSTALVLALIAVWQGWGIFGIILSGIIGETLSVISIFILLRVKLGINLLFIYKSIVISLLIAASTMVLALNFVTGKNPAFEIAGSIIAGICALAISMAFATDLLTWLKKTNKGQSKIPV
ncbi:oligosaccharide flippase family protein [Sneathiella sp.]|uniref:oligosaccharide flippase family protein n=1 Tax=Sneathiella sp. TaxID=1964365 RepID=UPI0035697083